MDVVVIILLESPEQIKSARILIDSLRSFGGGLSTSQVYLFKSDPHIPDIQGTNLKIFPLEMDARLKDFPLAGKVAACAQAEKIAGRDCGSLIWMNPETLVIKPPSLLELGNESDLAIRPVHIRNVGIPAGAPLDDYWAGIYKSIGLEGTASTVESFVDGQQLWAYYNTHVFSADPALELFGLWQEHFARLALDRGFQAGPCHDVIHKIFLHQAVLSVLIEKLIPAARLRLLPPDYSYPYNLQDRIPAGRRAEVLNDLTVMVYEQRPIDPVKMTDIAVEEPLRSWLGKELEINC
jgi:hypothetical protein